MTKRKEYIYEEKITRIASMLFALIIILGLIYLVITTSWLAMFFAICNILVLGGLAFLIIKEITRTLK